MASSCKNMAQNAARMGVQSLRQSRRKVSSPLGAPPCVVPSTANSPRAPSAPHLPWPTILPFRERHRSGTAQRAAFEGGSSRSARPGRRGHWRAGPSRMESSAVARTARGFTHHPPRSLRCVQAVSPSKAHVRPGAGVRADPGLHFSVANAQECDCRVFMMYNSLFFLT